MKKTQIIISFLLIASVTALPIDRVIVNGDTLITYSNILQQHPNKKELIDSIYSKLELEDRKINPQKYKSNESEAFEYLATWTIQKNKLMLCSINADFDMKVIVDLKMIFEKEMVNGVVFANWLTGNINLCKGKILAEGGEPIWDNEIELKITKGYLTKATAFKNHITKVSRFRNNNSFIYSRIDWDKLPVLKNNAVQAYIFIRPNKEGLLESIEESSFVYEDSKIVMDKENVFLKEAFRITRLVPEWDVIYRKNKIVIQPLVIIFDENNRKKYIH